MKMLHFSSENAEKVHYARNILYNFKYSIHGIFLENNVAFMDNMCQEESANRLIKSMHKKTS